MNINYAINVYKEYFNFSSAHFMIFENGEREFLHGHNYRVKVKMSAINLDQDMVFDFLDIKPIVKETCDELDHKLLIPQDNPHLTIETEGNNYLLILSSNDRFSIPKKDTIILPLANISAERLAIFLASKIKQKVSDKYNFKFSDLRIEVEETPGQSATYTLT